MNDQILQPDFVPQTLENVLVALQKSLSRVSESSAGMQSDRARALILGDVNFELSFPGDSREDRIFFTPNGNLNLKLSGTIKQDIRFTPRTDEAASQSGNQ